MAQGIAAAAAAWTGGPAAAVTFKRRRIVDPLNPHYQRSHQ